MKNYLLETPDVSGTYLIFAVVGILTLVAFVLIIRWLFKINETKAYQITVIALLREMALKNGVELEKVESILKYYKTETK